jgi:hypothetical protein
MVNLNVVRNVKRIVSLLFFVLFVGVEANSAEVFVNPVYSFSGNVDFAMIGNVNYKLTEEYRYGIETSLPLEEIDEDKVEETTNSSSASFCVNGQICKDDAILYAGITWSGRRPNPADDSWKKIQFSLNDGVYTTLTEESHLITTMQNANQDNADLYVCHADVTSYFPDQILASGSFKVTVANIVSETSNAIATKFGGWTLTVIYRQKAKSKATVSYYPLKVFEPCGANSLDGKPIKLGLNLKEEFSGYGDLILGLNTVGGARQATAEALYVSSRVFLEGKDSLDIFSPDAKFYVMPMPEYGYLDNSMQMRTGCEENADITTMTSIGYSRGYDLHIQRFSPDTVVLGTTYSRILKGSKSLDLLLKGNSEHHMITDAVVMTGLPQTPQIEAVQKAAGAHDSILYEIDINTKKNVEDLDNFALDVKLPDFTVKVSNFSISGPLLERGVSNAQSSNPIHTAFGVNSTGEYKNSSDSTKGWFGCVNIMDSNYQKAMNRKAGDNLDTFDFRYTGTIPQDMADTTILKILFTVYIDTLKYKEKALLTGDSIEIISQSKMTVIGSESEDTTAFYSSPESMLGRDDMDACDEFYNFGSGAGLGGGTGSGWGGGGGGGAGGGGCVNNPPTRFKLDFEFGCSNIPDTIHLDGCADACVDTSIIKELLLKEYNFDVDANAKKDSLNWIEVKLDSIVDLCQLAIKTPFRRGDQNLNVVYSDSANWREMKEYWETTGLKVPEPNGDLYKTLRNR